MKRLICWLAVMVLAVESSPIATAQGGPEGAYTFTGPIDHVRWPRSQSSYIKFSPFLNGEALFGDQFVTNDSLQVSFNNFSGNRAFYDGNNLLTKPAALINGNAWWTDPKETANGVVDGQARMEIGFFNSPLGFAQEFGFDAAMVRIDQDVPTALPFKARDSLNNIVSGQLVFEGASPYVVDQGTFFSLGTPRIGREAEFLFDVNSLFAAYKYADPAIDYDDPLQYGLQNFSIELNSLATFGGTSQFAIDNVVFGGTDPPPARTETTFVTTAHEYGPNTPVYYPFSGAGSVLQGAGNAAIIGLEATTGPLATQISQELARIYVLRDQLEDVDGVEFALGGLDLSGINVVSATARQAINMMQNGTAVEVEPAASDSVQITLHQTAEKAIQHIVQISGQIRLQILQQALSNVLKSRAGSPDVKPAVITESDLNDFIKNAATIRIFKFPSFGLDSASGVGDPLELDPLDTVDEILAATAAEPQYYWDYTVEDYIELKEETGESFSTEDTGAYLTYTVGDEGVITSIQYNAWIVADGSGEYLPMMYYSVPEPASLLLLVGLGGLGCRVRLRWAAGQ